MAAEICGAKLLAPFFGSSLYVWSSVMAITLAGLACGYFIGGKLSIKTNKQNILLLILIVAVSLIALMPYFTFIIYYAAIKLQLLPKKYASEVGIKCLHLWWT